MRNDFDVAEWLGALVLGLVVVAMVVLVLMGAAHGATRSKTLDVVQGFARWHEDRAEADADHEARVEALVEAVDGATSDRLERAELLVMMREETHLAAFVDLDAPRCRDGRTGWCDRGRAWSVWQLHGTDRTGDRAWAAREALRRLRSFAGYCARLGHDPVVGAFAIYATGARCETANGKARAAMAREMARGL